MASERQVSAPGVWVGNGKPDGVYASSEGLTVVLIDEDTTIDLRSAAAPTEPQPEVGLNLPNLIGTAGVTLTFQGNGDDLVTINPNIAVGDLPDRVGNSLSFDGRIDLAGTGLQLLATDAESLVESPETVYVVGDVLTADADSEVILTSGVLRLQGNGNQLLGGVRVGENGRLVLAGDSSLGGLVSGAAAHSEDVRLEGSLTLVLVDGTQLEDVRLSGEAGSVLRVETGAEATLSNGSSLSGVMLDLGAGNRFTIGGSSGAGSAPAGAVSVTGLSGSADSALLSDGDRCGTED